MALRNRPSPQQRAHCRLHERPPVGLAVLTMPERVNLSRRYRWRLPLGLVPAAGVRW